MGLSVNEQLSKKLHKPVIKKLKRRKVNARYKDNIWVADLAEMDSLSSKNEEFLELCVIDIFTKYTWVKKSKTFLNSFVEIVTESNRKRNKLWADQGTCFYNKLMQEW